MPIHILGGLKSISHSIRTSVYTYKMDVNPPIPVILSALRIFLVIRKYHIFYGSTWEIVTPRKHYRPRRSREVECFPRDANLLCHIVKNVIFNFIKPNVPFLLQISYMLYAL